MDPIRNSVSTICRVAVEVPSPGLRPVKPAGSGADKVSVIVSDQSTIMDLKGMLGR